MSLSHEANRTNRVEAGTLWVNGVSKPGAASTTAQWLVLTNATLGGSGIISNATVWVLGGTINPGTTNVAVFTVSSNVVFDVGAALTIDVTGSGTVAGTDYDQLLVKTPPGAVSGLANVALTVNVVGSPAVDNHTLRVISGGGNYSSQSFLSLAVQGLAGRTLVPTYGNGFVDVQIKNNPRGLSVFFR